MTHRAAAERSGEAPGAGKASASFLGRDRELADLETQLGKARQVTLTGAPGVGKSRLARELARRLEPGVDGGSAFVELAQVTDGRLVADAIASALGVQEVGERDLTDAVVASLRARELLLVLDNCEHLIEWSARMVSALIANCPRVLVVATSRAPLGVPGERLRQVPPLAVPPSGVTESDALEDYDAVRLLVQRARAVEPAFSLNPYVAPQVAEIARRLDGIPLALELAAGRFDAFTPAEIAARLDDRFSVLTSGASNGSAQHQALGAALDWSHNLLSESEQTLLRRLSVFVGGFEPAAAVAVCADEALEASRVPDVLAQLVSKSLVVGPGDGRDRYQLLETVRVYAAQKLESAGERAALGRAHAQHFLRLAEEAEPAVSGRDQQAWFARLEDERANLRAALEWSLGHGESEWALRMAGALVLFWRVRCHFSEGRELLEAAIAVGSSQPSGLIARALWGVGFMTLMIGNVEGARAPLEESRDRYEALDDASGQARALLILGNSRQYRGDPLALELLGDSATLARDAGDSWCLSHALAVAGNERYARGESQQAETLLEEAAGVARAAEDKQGLRYALLCLGELVGSNGDYDRAEPLLQEAVALTEELGEERLKADALRDLAQIAFARGELDRAAQLIDLALRTIRSVGSPAGLVVTLTLRGRVAGAQSDFALARELLGEALKVARASEDPATCFVLQCLGEVSMQEGDKVAARTHFEGALDLARSVGLPRAVAHSLHHLGLLALEAHDAMRGEAHQQEALALLRQAGNVAGTLATVEALAELAAVGGDYERAARLFGAMKAARERLGPAQGPWRARDREAALARVRAGLAAGEFEKAFAAGELLSIEQAAAEASNGNGRRGRPGSGWSSLTAREREVALLAGEGLTNPQIAERLVISSSTAKNHLHEAFAKLGVKRRSELARELARQSHQHPPPARP